MLSAPTTRRTRLEEKAGSYFQAPSGLPLAQHALPGLMGLVHDGLIDLPTLVAKTSHRVADLFEIAERGYLREGYWADLVLIGDRDHGHPGRPGPQPLRLVTLCRPALPQPG
jgi:dihydroorotase